MAEHVTKPHVVIIGGGFGGLKTARSLRRANVRITLIDKANHHLFQPLLYQVATAGMTAEEIAVPIRSVVRKQPNVQVLLGEVTRADLDKKVVYLSDGAEIAYDYLVVAAGARTNYFGHDDWAEHTVGLKSIEDAFEIRRRVLTAFEAAEREPDRAKRRALLTFVVIGGGPTGVELAGALSELTRAVLARDFRLVHAEDIRVMLLEAGPRLLAPFHESLSANAAEELQRLGVEVRLGTAVTDITPEGLRTASEDIPATLTCWAAGVAPQPLAQALGLATRRGLVEVTPDCSAPGRPEVFAIGDIASFIPEGSTKPLPGLAPVAMQQGVHVARSIERSVRGEAREPFRYLDKGNMATIGKSRAVLEFKGLRMTGLLAWLAWIVVHIYYLIGFRNRAVVMFDWFWSYLTNRRGARLITRAQVGVAQPPALSEKRAAPTPPAAPAAPSSTPATTSWRPVSEHEPAGSHFH
jgi:NADH dehydrogenase